MVQFNSLPINFLVLPWTADVQWNGHLPVGPIGIVPWARRWAVTPSGNWASTEPIHSKSKSSPLKSFPHHPPPKKKKKKHHQWRNSTTFRLIHSKSRFLGSSRTQMCNIMVTCLWVPPRVALEWKYSPLLLVDATTQPPSGQFTPIQDYWDCLAPQMCKFMAPYLLVPSGVAHGPKDWPLLIMKTMHLPLRPIDNSSASQLFFPKW